MTPPSRRRLAVTAAALAVAATFVALTGFNQTASAGDTPVTNCIWVPAALCEDTTVATRPIATTPKETIDKRTADPAATASDVAVADLAS